VSYLKNIAEAGKKQIVERVRQKPKTPKIKQEHLNLNPTIKSVKDIPNVNIMTSGKLLGIRLRDKKEPMLKQFLKYLTKLLEEENET
jgi:hypothetical protein